MGAFVLVHAGMMVVVFTLAEMTSGIGYVLARYQQLRKWQGEVVLCNLTRLNQTIFEMSGIFQIIRYEKSEGRK